MCLLNMWFWIASHFRVRKVMEILQSKQIANVPYESQGLKLLIGVI